MKAVACGHHWRTPDDEERETLEMLEKSCKLRGLPLPYRLALRLIELRKVGAS